MHMQRNSGISTCCPKSDTASFSAPSGASILYESWNFGDLTTFRAILAIFSLRVRTNGPVASEFLPSRSEETDLWHRGIETMILLRPAGLLEVRNIAISVNVCFSLFVYLWAYGQYSDTTVQLDDPNFLKWKGFLQTVIHFVVFLAVFFVEGPLLFDTFLTLIVMFTH